MRLTREIFETPAIAGIRTYEYKVYAMTIARPVHSTRVRRHGIQKLLAVDFGVTNSPFNIQ